MVSTTAGGTGSTAAGPVMSRLAAPKARPHLAAALPAIPTATTALPRGPPRRRGRRLRCTTAPR
eukprot:12922788-Prorocentrum_lima.AAC.1